MDSVLYKIIEIERSAQKIAETAELARRELPKEIEAEQTRLSGLIDKETSEKIESFAKTAAEEKVAALQQTEILKEEQIKTMRLLFSEKSEQWEQELFEKIIAKK